MKEGDGCENWEMEDKICKFHNLIPHPCPSTDDDADMHLATDLERVASLSEEDLERQMSNIEQELTDI